MLSTLFSKAPKMKWGAISSTDQLDDLDKKSYDRPVLIFKHSTRCSISAMALGRFERNYSLEGGFDPFLLDLIANREVSNEIANRYQITHESPQAILIKDGMVMHDSSHNAINFDDIKNAIKN